MNKFIATGNVVREMEVTYLNNGTALLKNALAVKDEFKKDKTYFFNFTAFGKTAETMANYLNKGSKILIEAQLTQSSYEKDGQKRTSTDVIVNRFEFLDSKKDNQSNQGSYSQPNPQTKTQSDPFASQSIDIDISDDSLPF